MSKVAVLRTSNVAPEASSSSASQGSPSKKGNQSGVGASFTASSKVFNQNFQTKKISRKSSKPILTWFQRKLGGSVKANKRTGPVPLNLTELGNGSPPGRTSVNGRTSSAPQTRGSGDKSTLQGPPTRRTTLSLTDEDGRHYNPSFDGDNGSIGMSTYARDSLWSPNSAMEADDDASVRPIPPSAPPSPSPSRSSSSVLSGPGTFRSIAASTKPTTVLSIDLGGNGMAHIAQVPTHVTTSAVHRIAPHIRHSSSLSTPAHSSGNPVTFSSLPHSQPQSSSPSSVRGHGSIGSLNFASAYGSPGVGSSHVQAPLHTSHHPRNNPRPSSPPMDNASMLTLASSAYAMPARGSGAHAYSIHTLGFGDNVSLGGSMVFPDGESTSQFPDDDDRDIDASVRALRPRSSRRGSWESEASRWSARVHGGAGPGTPSLMRNGSLWATNSVRTGCFSENTDFTKDGEEVESLHVPVHSIENAKSDPEARFSKATRFEIDIKQEKEDVEKHGKEAEDALIKESLTLEVPRLVPPRTSVETIGTPTGAPQNDDAAPPTSAPQEPQSTAYANVKLS